MKLAEQVIQIFNEQITVDSLVKNFPKIKKNRIEYYFDRDPTNNKKFIKWLLKLHVGRAFVPDDLDNIKKYLKLFEHPKVKNKLKGNEKNFADYKSFYAFRQAIDKVKPSEEDLKS